MSNERIDHKKKPVVTLLLPGGNRTFTFSFRHPVVKDKSGKYGLKIQRSTGVTDIHIAEKISCDVSQLISNEDWWDFDKRPAAYTMFDVRAVNAFYDCMNTK